MRLRMGSGIQLGGGELVVILGEFFFSGKDDWTYVWVGVLVL